MCINVGRLCQPWDLALSQYDAEVLKRVGMLLCVQGGSEAKHSNELLHRIISEAVEAVAPEVGPGLVSLINTREEIRDLLKLDDVIDLVCSLRLASVPIIPLKVSPT